MKSPIPVHILGSSNVSFLLAHSLALSSVATKPTLLLDSDAQLARYEINSGSNIGFFYSPASSSKPSHNLLTSAMLPMTHLHIAALAPTASQKKKALRRNFNPVTDLHNLMPSDSSPGAIENLVVATRATDTIQALSKWVPYLTPNSNVLFLQNGLGIVDRVMNEFWPEGTTTTTTTTTTIPALNSPSTTPNIYVGLSSHAVYKHPTLQTRLTQAGDGHLEFARYPSRQCVVSSELTPSELVCSLMGSDNLRATEISYLAMLIQQYERLIIGSCLNPVTSLLDCANGELLASSHTEHLMTGIIKEAIVVTKHHFDTILVQKSDLFSPLEKKSALLKLESTINLNRLSYILREQIQKTANNSTAMRHDLAYPAPGSRPETEIMAYNGWIAYWGRNHGLRTPLNSMLQTMIMAKADIVDQRESDLIKLEVGENID